MSSVIFRSAMFAIASVSVAACGDDEDASPVVDDDAGSENTIVDVAAAAGSFSTLVGALEATGLDDTLRGPGPFTVFAPTDEAFARLPAGVVDSLDAATLSSVLSYHVYAGEAPASTVTTLSSAPTVQGSDVAVSVQGGEVYLDGVAKVVQTDVRADNGLVHVIDAVLLPPEIGFPGTIVDALAAAPVFETLVQAVTAAGLAETLAGDNGGEGFTVFAPTNAAFEALGVDVATLSPEELTSILLYHVVGGEVRAEQVVELSSAETLAGDSIAIDAGDGAVTLNGEVDIVRTDLVTTNGVIHVIDGVLAR